MLTVKLYRQDEDTYREFTAAEYAQHEKDSSDEQTRRDAEIKAIASTEAARASGLAKLAAVGITADEIQALLEK